ncbi:conserved hypothetical protein [Magnetococcus marinus MC-1]|uniref:Uncharacterized protein n=1 Tax=Magnetococcus marinus (strain ATCC BAA-1437 / JCM 17883 / MC-1) TaxID=156889 RepID=A0L9U8_MAGMM|nr:hypothetical protein [Magnetococcus marinus]ABK44741.1 conserved hypothetical protein [Magnetococcus marinus MC-1]
MMPTTELIGKDQLSALTGKQFTVQQVGAGTVKLTPLDTTNAITLKGRVLLNGTEVQGLKTGTAQSLVQIEGAGTATSLTGSKTTITSFEANGTLIEGTKNGVMLTGGEAKITTTGKAVAANSAVKPAVVKSVPAKAAALNTAPAKAQTIALTKPASTQASGAAVASKVGGSIWSGTGWGLGLGLGLGVWGTVALGGVVTAAVGVGVYNYLKRHRGEQQGHDEALATPPHMSTSSAPTVE